MPSREIFGTSHAKLPIELGETKQSLSDRLLSAALRYEATSLEELSVGVATVTTSRGLEFGLSAELEDLYVLPETRGLGVGRTLIATVNSWCRQQGCSVVAVIVT